MNSVNPCRVLEIKAKYLNMIKACLDSSNMSEDFYVDVAHILGQCEVEIKSYHEKARRSSSDINSTDGSSCG